MKKSALLFFLSILTFIFFPIENCEAQVGALSRVFRAAAKAPKYGNSVRRSYRFRPRANVYKPSAARMRSNGTSRIAYGRNYRSYQGLKRKYSLNNATQIKLNHKRLGTINRNNARKALEVRRNKERLLAKQRTVELNRDKQIASIKSNAAKNKQTAKVVRERKKEDLAYLKKRRQQAKKNIEQKTLDEKRFHRKKKTLNELSKEKKANEKLALDRLKVKKKQFDKTKSLKNSYKPKGALKNKKIGHTFSKHGSHNTQELLDLAKKSGVTQGQWLNDRAAEKIIAKNLSKTKNGAETIRIPQGVGRLINPDGSFSPAIKARLVPSGSGVYTAYPVNE